MSKASVVIFDYGFGNIRSAQRALERVGAEVTVTEDTTLAAQAAGLVIPGVGAFAACMRALHESGGADLIRRRGAKNQPILGICVGAQVMFDGGNEHGEHTDGLGLLAGEITSLTAPILPHMGWNTVETPAGSALYQGIDPNERFYFVHSFAAHTTTADALVATCDYGERFIASVELGSLSVVQFHPEKSADTGAALLSNWIGTL